MNNNVMEIFDTPSLEASLLQLDEARPKLSNAILLPLPELVRLYESRRLPLDVLIHEYINTRRPEHEFAQHIWQTVHDYLQKLSLAYASSLQEQNTATQPANLRTAMLQRLDTLALLALWHCLRYQALTENYWRELHAAYQMAEPLSAIAEEAQTRYLQVLMLDSMSRNNLVRHKIALVNNWLGDWCREVVLSDRYDENLHQFFVDLQVPRGAQRIRKLTTGTQSRYWHLDSVIPKLKVMQQTLKQNKLPDVFPAKTALPNALRLVEKLLHEWSRDSTHRERRRETRLNVTKSAQVVHGILNVCQHVKNMGFAETAYPVNNRNADDIDENGWLIENESKSGFGTFVYADYNRWLEPGCLIAIDYDLNPGLTIVGIVRSIQERAGHKYFVGIEAFSHMPSYVRMQQLAKTSAVAAVPGTPPFSAILLPANDEGRQPATIVLPFADYVAGNLYELRSLQLKRIVQLGSVLEQQADWVRAKIDLVADIP